MNSPAIDLCELFDQSASRLAAIEPPSHPDQATNGLSEPHGDASTLADLDVFMPDSTILCEMILEFNRPVLPD